MEDPAYIFFKFDKKQDVGFFWNWAEKYAVMKLDKDRIFLYEDNNKPAKSQYPEFLILSMLKV